MMIYTTQPEIARILYDSLLHPFDGVIQKYGISGVLVVDIPSTCANLLYCKK